MAHGFIYPARIAKGICVFLAGGIQWYKGMVAVDLWQSRTYMLSQRAVVIIEMDFELSTWEDLKGCFRFTLQIFSYIFWQKEVIYGLLVSKDLGPMRT